MTEGQADDAINFKPEPTAGLITLSSASWAAAVWAGIQQP
jgi:hypothetical protein